MNRGNRRVVAGLACAALITSLACGKYGRAVRVVPTEPAVSAEPEQVFGSEAGSGEEPGQKKSTKR